jgi:hypothetical protein
MTEDWAWAPQVVHPAPVFSTLQDGRRSRHGILRAMNVPRRLAIVGIASVAAIALAAMFYVIHMPQPNAPALGAPSSADSLSTATPEPLSTGANISNATEIPPPNSACSYPLCFVAGEPYPPYWQLLTGDFLAYYPLDSTDAATDTSIYTVDFGDGTMGTLSDYDVGCTDSLDEPCSANFRTKHKYSVPGEYKVSLYKDGKPIIDQLNITIATPSDVCKLDNVLIPEGSGLTAYNGTCDSEPRLCTNGVLSGTYKYARCPPAAR